jgi:phosphoribosylformylglycinamidine synthase I
MNPKALIITGVGINSNRELAEAFELAGASAEQLHISEIEAQPQRLLDYQCLAFPGGFSYGDHVASGKILGNLIKAKAAPLFQELKDRGVPMIGICNGFQILVKMGWLPQLDNQVIQQASLIHNDSARYENRWVKLGVTETARQKSPWLKDIETLDCPVRHGEGKLVFANDHDLEALEASGQVAVRYLKDGEPSQDYPENPNGSFNAIAGLIDPTGLIFGLMPHPEVAIHPIQNPQWSRLGLDYSTTCLQLFKNIVAHIQSK